MKTLATADEVGILLHRRPSTIHRWARNGTIPSLPAGDGIAFDLEAVARWAESRQGDGGRRPRRACGKAA